MASQGDLSQLFELIRGYYGKFPPDYCFSALLQRRFDGMLKFAEHLRDNMRYIEQVTLKFVKYDIHTHCIQVGILIDNQLIVYAQPYNTYTIYFEKHY